MISVTRTAANIQISGRKPRVSHSRSGVRPEGAGWIDHATLSSSAWKGGSGEKNSSWACSVWFGLLSARSGGWCPHAVGSLTSKRGAWARSTVLVEAGDENYGSPIRVGVPASHNLVPGGFTRGKFGCLSARAIDDWCY